MHLKRELINAAWACLPRTVRVEIGGARYRLPLQRGFDRRLLHSDREPWLDEILRQSCAASGAVLLDVGANCGQTLLKAKAIQPALRYIGCEPNPACAGYLQALIATNQFSDCQVFACALSDRRHAASLFTAAPADPSATTIPNFRGAATGSCAIDVWCLPGDELLQCLQVPRLDVVKIDVEGAEAAVIAGLRESIARHRPVLVCEMLSSHGVDHPTHGFRAGSKLAIGEMLKSLQYRFLGIEGERQVAVEELSDRYRNYLLRPKR